MEITDKSAVFLCVCVKQDPKNNAYHILNLEVTGLN